MAWRESRIVPPILLQMEPAGRAGIPPAARFGGFRCRGFDQWSGVGTGGRGEVPGIAAGIGTSRWHPGC